MKKKGGHTLIFIAGDGRSGSSLLSLALNANQNHFVVGEAYRFWKRYYNNNLPTNCGCKNPLVSCPFWGKVHEALVLKFPNYDGNKIWSQIQELLKYENAASIEAKMQDPNFKEFKNTITYFYTVLFEISGASVIVDSSKNIGWARLINVLDIEIKRYYIYLKRNLKSVANSWKKTIELPEFSSPGIYMPKKSNWTILKSRIKIFQLIKPLRKQSNFKQISFEHFTKNPVSVLSELSQFTNLTFPEASSIRIYRHHAIGGNPIFYSSQPGDELQINSSSNKLDHLSFWDRFFFSCFWYL